MARSIRALSLLLMCVFVLSGCGGPAPAPSSAPPASAPAASATASAAAPAADSPAYEMPKLMTVAGSNPGGVYLAITTGIVNSLTAELGQKGFNATIMSTGGAAENCSVIQEGTCQFGMTQVPMAYAAYNGQAPYPQKMDKLRAVYNGLSEGVFHCVTLKSSGIQSIYDLKGKRVCMGGAGAGATTQCTQLFPEYGFTVKDVQASDMNYNDAATALADGKIDAICLQIAVPAAGILDLMTTKGKDVLIFGVEGAERDAVLAKYPTFSKYTLEPDTYGFSEPVETICLKNMLICSADLPEGFVYDLCRATFTDKSMDSIHASHPAAQNFSLETAANDIIIPFHPGAEKFFKEKGLLK